MSGSSSYNTFESEDESTGWLLTSETSLDDELTDELTLLNGDEDCDEDTLSFDALIKLSMRLKKQYNLREATVQLERCDKIWDTMQLVKTMQIDYESESTLTDDKNDEGDKDDEKESEHSPSVASLHLPEGANTLIPYIKYQPVQGNGNNALPNFYLAVKSQKKLYNCVTCGKQYSEKRSLVLHSQKEHGVVIPKAMKKNRSTDNKTASQDSADNTSINNSSNGDRENSKPRLSSTSKNSTEQQPERKDESDTSASPFTLSEPKIEEEASPATEEVHAKTFICPVCKAAYRYQRGVTKHMMNVHDMTLAEARSEYHDEETTATKPLLKNYTPPKSQEVKIETSRVTEEIVPDVDTDGPPNSETSASCAWHYIFTCKTCGRAFSKKADLRVHARKRHKITIPKDRSPRRTGCEQTREYEFYKCERIKVPCDGSTRSNGSKMIRGGKQEDRAYYAKILKEETQQPKTMRSGRQISDSPTVNRPRRACAIKTSYTECTKEEEEVLQSEFILSNVTGESVKPLINQTTPCFLCKKAFVDIRKHLIDYHRISCPDTILPLTAKAVQIEKEESLASAERAKSFPESTEVIRPNQRIIKQRKKEWKNPNIRILFDSKIESDERRPIFQCVVCLYKFGRLAHIRRHLVARTVNGVLQKHLAPKRYFKLPQPKVLEDPVVDPSISTDSTHSSTGETLRKGNNVETKGRKRSISPSVERLSSSSEHRNKRRKFENPKKFVNLESESTSDSVQYDNERKSALATSETDCNFNEEDKSANPRDTRDSSDRDSGIGISITIKKRNNSYEVVEKDSGDDDKSKDFEHSKDDNTCSDSSSDATRVNFVNDDQEARRREILNLLDYSAEKNVVGLVRADYEDDNAFGKKSGDESCSSNDKDENFHWKKKEYYGENACANSPGKVPSLKVMCRTVLRRNDFRF